MADDPPKDFVEGFLEGKGLESEMSSNTLQQQRQKYTQLSTNSNKELQAATKKLEATQEKLDVCNREIVDLDRKLDGLRVKQKERKLDAETKSLITDLARDTLNRFLRVRPRSSEESSMRVSVDVHFLPGNETTASNLRIGGEGAGSRNAQFQVKLDDKIESLAKQAAKYWGLDDGRVFFLDNEGRIVPESARMSDIILPPKSKASRANGNSPTSALAIEDGAGGRGGNGVGSALAPIPEVNPSAIELSVPAEQEEPSYTVEGRNYCLTLVRATTVLDKEDLNEPKGGEKWSDFTFNETNLNAELEATRKKRGDVIENNATRMDDIPNLSDLIKEGQAKKKQKLLDTTFRLLEFTVFCASTLIYYVLILKPNSTNLGMTFQLGSFSDVLLSNFTYHEQKRVGISSFKEIRSMEQYLDWFHGPLQRSVVTPALQANNLYVLDVRGFVYAHSPVEPLPGQNWCNGYVESESNESNTSDVVCNTTDTNTTNPSSGNATNTTNCTTVNTTTRRLSEWPKWEEQQFLTSLADAFEPADTYARRMNSDCVPDVLQSCKRERTINIFKTALKNNEQVPPCERPWYDNVLEVFFQSFSAPPFSSVTGQVGHYTGGTKHVFNTTNDESWYNSTRAFLTSVNASKAPARMVAVSIFSASLNEIYIIQKLAESTYSGAHVMTSESIVIDFSKVDTLRATATGVLIVLTFACFLMELRRVLGRPKRFFFEAQRSKAGLTTSAFVLLPIMILALFGLHIQRHTAMIENALTLSDDGTLSDESIDKLAVLEKLDRANTGLEVATLIMFNMLFFRYATMYFPFMVFFSQMVMKLTKPLLTCFLLLALALLCFVAVLYTMYSPSVYELSNLLSAIVGSGLFGASGLRHWQRLYEEYPILLPITMSLAYVIVKLAFGNLVIAIMASHKKERDLFENYSYHPYWATERSRQTKDPKDFDPALVGWDFTKKEPVEGNKDPGLKVK